MTAAYTGNRVGPENEIPDSTEVQAGQDASGWARRDSNARPLAPERRPDRQPPSANAEPQALSPSGRSLPLTRAGGVCHRDWHSASGCQATYCTVATRLKATDLSAARYLDNWSRSVRRGHWDVWEIATAREYLATYWIEYVEAPAAGWQAALRCSWAARNPHHLTRT
jgi:hypothetical protein